MTFDNVTNARARLKVLSIKSKLIAREDWLLMPERRIIWALKIEVRGSQDKYHFGHGKLILF